VIFYPSAELHTLSGGWKFVLYPKTQHMRTTVKPDFLIPENDALSGKLNQLTHEFPLSYIFYHPGSAKDAAHIHKMLIKNHRLRRVIFPNGASCFQVLKTF